MESDMQQDKLVDWNSQMRWDLCFSMWNFELQVSIHTEVSWHDEHYAALVPISKRKRFLAEAFWQPDLWIINATLSKICWIFVFEHKLSLNKCFPRRDFSQGKIKINGKEHHPLTLMDGWFGTAAQENKYFLPSGCGREVHASRSSDFTSCHINDSKHSI